MAAVQKGRKDTGQGQQCSLYDGVGCLDRSSSDDNVAQTVVITQLKGGLQGHQDALTDIFWGQDVANNLLLGSNEIVHVGKASDANLNRSHGRRGQSKEVIVKGREGEKFVRVLEEEGGSKNTVRMMDGLTSQTTSTKTGKSSAVEVQEGSYGLSRAWAGGRQKERKVEGSSDVPNRNRVLSGDNCAGESMHRFPLRLQLGSQVSFRQLPSIGYCK